MGTVTWLIPLPPPHIRIRAPLVALQPLRALDAGMIGAGSRLASEKSRGFRTVLRLQRAIRQPKIVINHDSSQLVTKFPP